MNALANTLEVEITSAQAEEVWRSDPFAAARGTTSDAYFSRPIRLSAVVATYQGERFLREQLRSMLKQTVPLDEIIITDDCSSDTTLEIARSMMADATISLRILRSDRNVGVGKNFERGLSLARGDIVFLADQDDVWRADKVERMLREFSFRPDVDLLFTDARLVNEDGNPLDRTLFRSLRIHYAELKRIRLGRAFEALLRRNLATGATIAMRRAIMVRALPIPDGWLHDEWIAMVAAASGRIGYVREALTDYRQHDGNHIGTGPDTVVSALAKLGSCRRCFNCRLAKRTELQIERLRALDPPASEQQIGSLQSKLEHLRRRCLLPRSRLARVPTVLRETLNGGYRRYSSGLRSIVGDLFGAIHETTDPHCC
jgi:hypothetical protein